MLRPLRFTDRADAGKELARRLVEFSEPPSVVLGVPHGGVVIAASVARALRAPLAAVWVRRLASPREPDVVIGAVDVDGDVTLGTEMVRAEGLSDDDVAELAYHAHQRLLADWERTPGLDATALLPGANAIIIDDGLTTGLTLRAAMRWARRQFVRSVVLAVPVVDARTWHRVAADADRAVTLEERDEGPIARSEIYDDYRRVGHDDMADLLARSAGAAG